MKTQCDKHGYSELLCGCPTECLNDGDYFETIRAKNTWINGLLKAHEEMKDKLIELGEYDSLSDKTKWADIIPEEKNENFSGM
jgi:hypothetical protein